MRFDAKHLECNTTKHQESNLANFNEQKVYRANQ